MVKELSAKIRGMIGTALGMYDVQKLDVEALDGFVNSSTWNGDKFYNGFGITKDYEVVDHWLLRMRSKQLFTENLYARGLIRRLITNEINKGLSVEAVPDAEILGLSSDELSLWSENVERRYTIYGKNPDLCDYAQMRTMGAIQRQARMMALVSGDVLAILRQGLSKLPNIELVDAELVANPNSDTQIRAAKNRGNEIIDGVEVDPRGRHIAYFVTQKNGNSRRITQKGSRTGRKQAWLLYGTERLLGQVRGQCFLALIMQSMKEIDRYRDSELRAAVINSMIALWIEKTQPAMGSLPLLGGALRKDTITTQDDSQGHKDVQFSQNMPGMMFQELQVGEKPQSFDTKRPNVNFGAFEASMANAFAWANEMPPEIFMLVFSSNYSASRGAVNEFKLYLNKFRSGFGEEFNNNIYQEFLISEVLNGNITAPGFLESWRNIKQWDTYGAWIGAEWIGAIKPNADMLKEVKAYAELLNQGLITRDRASRELTGMKYSKAVQQLVNENKMLVEANQPLIDAGMVNDQNQITDNSNGDDIENGESSNSAMYKRLVGTSSK